MSKLTEIIETEKKRDTLQDARVMHLYQEGTFYRAYNWSAWLWCKYVKNFVPTHRRIKNSDDTIIHIGCPVTSLPKHLPDDATVAQNDDKSITATAKKMQTTAVSGLKFDGQPATITGIMQQILAFPIEKKSPTECVSFLSDIKVLLAKMI